MLYLLENGADIDMFNNHHNTPFFLATESLQKEICQVENIAIFSDFLFLWVFNRLIDGLIDGPTDQLTDRLTDRPTD